ncbi:hypothetical protein LCGC14_2134170 [marine sediment metagenome]|uniref:Uncharacterized protein n=1 Tax=marine sediment metagenome TaxID=412755 RepID=A0A0F9EMN0_9ZZZZ
MIRTKLAKKVLTKKEQRHLTKDANVHSMATFIRSRKKQDEMREESLARGVPIGLAEPCWDCAHIAVKLTAGDVNI